MTTDAFTELFRGRETSRRRIEADDRHGIVRRKAELLLEQAHQLPIKGMKKLAEDAGSLGKFNNLLAELRFALVLARLGGEVELLRDQAFGQNDTYTPDLLVRLPGNLHALVEVTTGSDGTADVTSDLDAEINSKGLPFRVIHILGHQLSVPVLDHGGRTENERLSKDVVRRAVEGMGIAHASGWRDGVVYVLAFEDDLRIELVEGRREALPLEEDIPRRTAERWMGSFVFETMPDGLGYASGGVTSVHMYDDDAQKKKFLRELERKAEKHARLPPAHASTPFLLAFQNDDVELSPIDVLSVLTGSRCAIRRSAGPSGPSLGGWPAELAAKIESARAAGWNSLLREWDYGSTSPFRFTDFGAYLSSSWSRNVSGILVIHRREAPLQWLPNPFSQIAESRLLEIGLPLNKLGASVDGAVVGL